MSLQYPSMTRFKKLTLCLVSLTVLSIDLLQLEFVNSLSFQNPVSTFSSENWRTKSVAHRSEIPGLRNQREQYSSTHKFSSTALKVKIGSTVTTKSKLLEEIPPKLDEFLIKLDTIYTYSSNKIRCPFLRRRTADAIDSIVSICRFLVIRHKSLGIPVADILEYNNEEYSRLLPPGCKAIGRHVKKNADGTVYKQRGLPIEKIMEIIKDDWKQSLRNVDFDIETDHQLKIHDEKSIDKGYYITGRLDSTIYKDDCLFDGPDPDMPVRGLRKYLSAASHLFDYNQSYARLISIECDKSGGNYHCGMIKANWEIGGVLMLPWKPKVKSWTGSTIYHIDESGLIAFHDESWDISVLEAFVSTMWPQWSEKIWQNKNRILQT